MKLNQKVQHVSVRSYNDFKKYIKELVLSDTKYDTVALYPEHGLSWSYEKVMLYIID